MAFFNSPSQCRQLCCGLLAVLLLTPFLSTAANAATVLFITRNNGTWTAQEILRRDLFISWGHSILPLDQGVDQATYDAAVDQADVAFYGEEINSAQLGFSPLGSCIGAVIEEDNLSDVEFGFSSTSANYSRTSTYIVGPIHYITAGFPSGSATIFSPADRIHHLGGTIAPGALTLAYDTATNDITLAVLDIGDQLYGTLGTATARRVWLPWGASSMDFANVTAAGRTLLQRSIDWAAQVNTCTRLSKAAFLSDGTRLADGINLPIGTNVDFLLYINNSGAARSDVSIRDILDPTFLYQTSSMRVDNSRPQCATSPCAVAEEAAIRAAAKSGTAVTDTIDGDVANASGGIINAGNAAAANTQLDIAANRIWALLFSVTIQ